jgi:peroxiredoxin
VRLADWRPAPGIVYFWSIDCSVCRVELPDLDALYRRFSPRGLQLLAITAPQDRPDRVVQATRALGLPFPVALDFDGRAGRAFGGVALTPTTFLIDGAGQIRARITGRFAPRDLAAAIEALLAARSAPPAISGANGQRTAQGDRR